MLVYEINMKILSNNLQIDMFGILACFIAIAILYFKWSFNYWKRKGVVSLPATIPLGNATNSFFLRVSLGEELADIYKQLKGLRYAGFYFLSKPILLLFDVDLIKTILTKDFQYFTDHGNYVNEKDDPLSGHLFSLKGQKWKNLRAKLTPTFTSGKMKMMFQTLVDCSQGMTTLVDEMAEENRNVDIKDVVGRFTTDVIGSCGFGIDCNSIKNPNSEFRKYGKKVFEVDFVQAIKNFLSICFPKALEMFKIPLTKNDVTKFFMNVVNETVSYREKNEIIRKDFMHLLIQLRNNIQIQEDSFEEKLSNDSNETGKTLTMAEIAAQAFVFFIAGFETSSTTLTFCFYELVENISIQDKLREEIKDILHKYEGKLSYDAIMDMVYMDKCINETLRKYPPVPFLSRECTKTYDIPDSNVQIDKDTLLFIPILGIQRDPQYYPNPDIFDPERFSPENKLKRHPFAWLPFGEGPRSCIGLRFGIMQAKVALAVLLYNYKFSLSSQTKTPLAMDPTSLIMSAAGGIWLKAEKLKHNS